MTTTIDTVTYHRIRARRPNGFGWASLEWTEDGRVHIDSDYGCWSYFWGPHGGHSVPAFLAALNRSYMGGKMLGADIQVFDLDRSIEAAKRHIITLRRDGDIDQEKARSDWNDLVDVTDEHEWNEWVRWSLIDDAWELSCTRMASDWANFWRDLWEPLLLPALREIVAKEKAAC